MKKVKSIKELPLNQPVLVEFWADSVDPHTGINRWRQVARVERLKQRVVVRPRIGAPFVRETEAYTEEVVAMNGRSTWVGDAVRGYAPSETLKSETLPVAEFRHEFEGFFSDGWRIDKAEAARLAAEAAAFETQSADPVESAD